MKLIFATESFRNECNNQDLLVKRYGALRARSLRQRLDELSAAEVLEDMRSMPHVPFHAFPDSPGVLAVEVGTPYWLTFRPISAGESGPPGGWDWKKIDSILIVGLPVADEKRSPKPI